MGPTKFGGAVLGFVKDFIRAETKNGSRVVSPLPLVVYGRCLLRADSLLKIEFDHPKALFISRQSRIQIQAQTLRGVRRHNNTIV